MAKTGRPRVPTPLKLLKGNPGRRPLEPEKEMAPPVVVPACPRFLKGEARKEWRRVTKELLALGLISKLDRGAIAGYCLQWQRFVDAELKLASEPLVFKTPGGYPIQSPWLSIANKSLELLHKIATEFGFTAASRTRIKVDKPAPVDPADKFFGGPKVMTSMGRQK